MHNKIVILILLVMSLIGCASVQQICAGYGFTPGTNEFANCSMAESYNRQQAIQNFTNQMQQNSRDYTNNLNQIYQK